jgi:hypothetical protein
MGRLEGVGDQYLGGLMEATAKGKELESARLPGPKALAGVDKDPLKPLGVLGRGRRDGLQRPDKLEAAVIAEKGPRTRWRLIHEAIREAIDPPGERLAVRQAHGKIAIRASGELLGAVLFRLDTVEADDAAGRADNIRADAEILNDLEHFLGLHRSLPQRARGAQCVRVERDEGGSVTLGTLAAPIGESIDGPREFDSARITRGSVLKKKGGHLVGGRHGAGQLGVDLCEIREQSSLGCILRTRDWAGRALGLS